MYSTNPTTHNRTPFRPPFHDRNEAGIALASALSALLYPEDLEEALVMGAVRGGMPVAFEVARTLDLPLDVMVVRKLRLEGNEDLPMGAVASGPARFVNAPLLEKLAIPTDFLEAAIAREEAEVSRLLDVFHHERPPAPVKGRTIILVDDGIVSGSTIASAVLSLRNRGAGEIIVGVPVGTLVGESETARHADRVVVLETLPPDAPLSAAYSEFPETTETDVQECLGSWELDPPAVGAHHHTGLPPR